MQDGLWQQPSGGTIEPEPKWLPSNSRLHSHSDADHPEYCSDTVVSSFDRSTLKQSNAWLFFFLMSVGETRIATQMSKGAAAGIDDSSSDVDEAQDGPKHKLWFTKMDTDDPNALAERGAFNFLCTHYFE